MKNVVLTFLLALLVVVTAVSLRRAVAGNAATAGQSPTLVAIGTSPVPLPPPGTERIGTSPVPLPPPGTERIGSSPVPLPPPGT